MVNTPEICEKENDKTDRENKSLASDEYVMKWTFWQPFFKKCSPEDKTSTTTNCPRTQQQNHGTISTGSTVLDFRLVWLFLSPIRVLSSYE